MDQLPDPLPESCSSCATPWTGVQPRHCDGCGARGLIGRLPCKHMKKRYAQFVLERGTYPWTGNVEGNYCMRCSFPPR